MARSYFWFRNKTEDYKMLRKFAYSSALLVGTASTAFAGGLAEPVAAPTAVVPVPVVSVPSNDWTGFYVGGSIGQATLSPDGSPDTDANAYGVNVGYLRDLGSIVVGGELDYSRYNLDGTSDTYDGAVTRLKGRVGYDAGAFLPYITAGGANLSLNDGSDASDTGYFYGIGADYAVNDTFLVGGEFLQNEFENFDNSGVDLSAKTLALRVSYKF
tara:strand:- start:506 stop:1147 length:642 start_codon:yes stop_codon:yes gene_type:complete